MSELEHLQQQIIDLQSQVAFQDDHINEVTRRLTEQDSELARIQLQLQHIARLLKERGNGSGDTTIDDERPPHY